MLSRGLSARRYTRTGFFSGKAIMLMRRFLLMIASPWLALLGEVPVLAHASMRELLGALLWQPST